MGLYQSDDQADTGDLIIFRLNCPCHSGIANPEWRKVLFCQFTIMDVPRIFILSGPLQSGKSSALMHWVRDKRACGFITPTSDGIKVLYDVTHMRYYEYELTEPRHDTLIIGNFFLDKKAFSHADNFVDTFLQQMPAWAIFDEIGKLELEGSGFHLTVDRVLKSGIRNILFVARQCLIEGVDMTYGNGNALHISKLDLDHLI
ncbi:nucleoside-triphosphatase [Pedobacter jamesrossensis]|uniref:Nucleoside-triphosphatase n=1 Tax=Pedobacter jamesrossensis TaxID=1908238 RepID=A0ABV8NKV9_9SPHI